MPQRRTHIIVGLATLVVCLLLSLIVGVVTSNAVAVVLTSFLTAFLGIMVDLRMSYNDLLHRLSPARITNYERLQNDNSPLFRKMAIEKYRETENFFQNLLEGRIEESDPSRIIRIIEFLLTQDNEVRSISAISYGELDEWVTERSWFTTEHLRLHIQAHDRGVSVERIFLTHLAMDNKLLRDACRQQAEHFVTVRVGDPGRMPPEMLHRAGNAVIYFDRDGDPIYAVRADHHNGKLDKVTYYRDREHVQPIWEACKHIRALARPYKPPDSE
jgi:hypothetical protein